MHDPRSPHATHATPEKQNFTLGVIPDIKGGKIRKYVLTGGTSVGKTTVLDLLSGHGHPTLPEFCRTIINDELAKEDGILPWKKPAEFQDMYAKRQMKEELNIASYAGEKDYIFMDRSILDAKAFCLQYKTLLPLEIDMHARILERTGQRYDLIFILEPLETYHNDPGRVMSAEESASAQNYIKQVYAEYGYETISVPFMPAEERVKFILEKADELTV